jgi:hypothetical protein
MNGLIMLHSDRRSSACADGGQSCAADSPRAGAPLTRQPAPWECERADLVSGLGTSAHGTARRLAGRSAGSLGRVRGAQSSVLPGSPGGSCDIVVVRLAEDGSWASAEGGHLPVWARARVQVLSSSDGH